MSIDTLADTTPAVAITHIARVYQQWRPLLSKEQLAQLAAAYRKILPAMLEQCQSLSASSPQHAAAYFQNCVILHLDLLADGLAPGQCTTLQEQISTTANQVLTNYLMQQKDGSLQMPLAITFHCLVQYCLELGGLEKSAAQQLCTLIAQKAAEAEKSTQEQEQAFSAELERLLKAGDNQTALALCIHCLRRQAGLWNNVNCRNHYTYLKKALKGELACLCLQLGKQGLNQATVERINKVLNSLQELKDSPWLIGRKNCCTLNTLATLASPETQPSSSSTSSQPKTPEASAATCSPEVSEAEWQKHLTQPNYSETFRQRMKGNREQQLPEARRWLEFLTQRYAPGSVPAFQTNESDALFMVFSGTACVLITALFKKAGSVSAEDENFHKNMEEVTGDMLTLIHPLAYTNSLKYLKDNYKNLRGFIHKRYLKPLITDIRSEDSPDNKHSDLSRLQRLFAEAHRVIPLYDQRDRNSLCLAFTRIFQCDPEKICRNLHSDDSTYVKKGLKELEELVLDRQHFYSRDASPKGHRCATTALRAAQTRLRELVENDQRTWEPVKNKFLQKLYTTHFVGQRPYKPQQAKT